MFYSIFSALFTAVGYIAAQARKVQNFTKQLRRSLCKSRKLKAIVLKNSKIYIHAAFTQEENRIAIKDNNIL